MNNKSVQLNIVVDKELKEAFYKATQNDYLTISEALRCLMRKYIKGDITL